MANVVRKLYFMHGFCPKMNKKCALLMYKRETNTESEQIELALDDLALPFPDQWDYENRWVKLGRLIPWDRFEKNYAELFESDCGNAALPFRVALGSLIIKERLSCTDREAVEQISENPYLQHFLGFKTFQTTQPFDPSLYVHFRKRIGIELLREINAAIVAGNLEKFNDNDDEPDESERNVKIRNCDGCSAYKSGKASQEAFVYLDFRACSQEIPASQTDPPLV